MSLATWQSPLTSESDVFDARPGGIADTWARATWERAAAAATLPLWLRWVEDGNLPREPTPGMDGTVWWAKLQLEASRAHSQFRRGVVYTEPNFGQPGNRGGSRRLAMDHLEPFAFRRRRERLVHRLDATHACDHQGGATALYVYPAQPGHHARFIVDKRPAVVPGATPSMCGTPPEQHYLQGMIVVYAAADGAASAGWRVAADQSSGDILDLQPGLARPHDLFGLWIVQDIRACLRECDKTFRPASWVWAHRYLECTFMGSANYGLTGVANWETYESRFDAAAAKGPVGGEGDGVYEYYAPNGPGFVIAAYPPTNPPGPVNFDFVPMMMERALGAWGPGYQQTTLQPDRDWAGYLWAMDLNTGNWYSSGYNSGAPGIGYRTFFHIDTGGAYIGTTSPYPPPVDSARHQGIIAMYFATPSSRNTPRCGCVWVAQTPDRHAMVGGQQMFPHLNGKRIAEGVSRLTTFFTLGDDEALAPENIDWHTSGLLGTMPVQCGTATSSGYTDMLGPVFPQVLEPVPFWPATAGEDYARWSANPNGKSGRPKGWQASHVSAATTWFFNYP